jgi:hypothetical protein
MIESWEKDPLSLPITLRSRSLQYGCEAVAVLSRLGQRPHSNSDRPPGFLYKPVEFRGAAGARL